MAGIVEVDEVYIGGVEEGSGGRSLKNKALVAAPVEVPDDRAGLGRARLARLPDAGAAFLGDFVHSQVARPGTVTAPSSIGNSPKERRQVARSIVGGPERT